MGNRTIQRMHRGIPQGRPKSVPAKAAAALVKHGTHAYTDEQEPVRDASYSTKDETPEISPRTGKPKRQYRRRDMKAEG